jgi:hypothetical protein
MYKSPFVIDPTKIGPFDRCLVCFTKRDEPICKTCGHIGGYLAGIGPRIGLKTTARVFPVPWGPGQRAGGHACRAYGRRQVTRRIVAGRQGDRGRPC